MTVRRRSIEELYELLSQLSHKLDGAKRLADCHGTMNWPVRGVYFFFEQGEYRFDSHELRVVRVGTHAVSIGSKTTLWKRLYAHRGPISGGGNHRGSIFRLHVGRAMLNRDGDSGYLHWGRGSSASKVIRSSEDPLERRVSEYIGNMRVLWLKIDDEPSKDSYRSYIERNAIALLAGENGQSPVDPSSSNWLGRYSDREKIRFSGLWNLEHIGSPDRTVAYNPAFLAVFRRFLNEM